MGPGLVAAKAAKIPVFLAAGVGVPQGAVNDLYGNTEADNPLQGVLRLLDLMTVDSKGTGSVLLVNAPDYPILAPIDDDAATKYVAANCSGCSIQTLGICPGRVTTPPTCSTWWRRGNRTSWTTADGRASTRANNRPVARKDVPGRSWSRPPSSWPRPVRLPNALRASCGSALT